MTEVATGGIAVGFAASHFSSPDGILRRLDHPKAPVVSFEGGALSADELGQGGGPVTRAAVEAAAAAV